MLLTDYTLEIFNSKCQPQNQGVHCFVHLKQDVGQALPYVNAVLGGYEYFKDPPTITFKAHGKIITIYGDKIAVNALKDAAEAEKIAAWLVREINEAWENRDNIEPSYEGAPKPKLIDILKLLPKTNCRKCGAPTCMVFATRLMEGGGGAEDCPELADTNRAGLSRYLSGFGFD